MCDLDEHAIAMHRCSNRMRRNEDVTRKFRLKRRAGGGQFGDDEAEAIAVQAELASDKILSRSRLRNCIAVGIGSDELACCD